MGKNHKSIVFILLALIVVIAVSLVVSGGHVAVLSPEGSIAAEQRRLLIFATALTAVVVLPVFCLTFYIAWKYRASNTKAAYTPDWDGDRRLEFTWWAIPLAIITILGVVTWTSSHQLDPFRPLVSNEKPVRIQVIALQWKWLFLYPQQGIASLNYVQFPKETPINFEITADAPMNSFWIPKLGGQIYAMAGMQTKLHLMADRTGQYEGSSANISGDGFADMRFTAHSSSRQDFDAWVRQVRSSNGRLDLAAYNALAEPSKKEPSAYYATYEKGLYDTVMMKYMMPGAVHDLPKPVTGPTDHGSPERHH